MSQRQSKYRVFRTAIGIYAVLALIPLGLMHVFFPDQYFAMIEYPLWDPNDDVQREMVELIGSFFVAQAVGAWLIRRNVLRNRDTFITMLVAMVMTEAVVIYTILIGVAPRVVWFNTVLPYLVLLTVLVFSYPWREASQYGKEHCK